MKSYRVYEKKSDAFHYVGEFDTVDKAISFAKQQTTQVAVTAHTNFADCPIIYKNY